MFLESGLPKRLDEEAHVLAVLRALDAEGFDRAGIETALIQQTPVDLDLLAACYERLFGDGDEAVRNERDAA